MTRRRAWLPTPGDQDAPGEPLATLHAEVLHLREENARLRGAQHQRAGLARLLGRARSLPATAIDRDPLDDDAAQLLIDGLVVRESLLEICEDIERSMVAFEAKLQALVPPAVEDAYPSLPAPAPVPPSHTNGHGPAA